MFVGPYTVRVLLGTQTQKMWQTDTGIKADAVY